VSGQTNSEISITVNGQIMWTRSETLDGLLREQGLETQKVATAVNGDFVPRHARAETRLAAEDRIEVVSARQGG
jgi:sulfur carrier protein